MISEMKKIWTLISLLGLLSFTDVMAQAYQLSLSINVNPPYSANYTNYFSSLNQISVTIVNSSSTQQSIYLAGSISTLDGDIFVRTADDQPWPGDALIIPPGPSTTLLTGIDLQPFAENSSIEYGGISPLDISTGLLPEGDYQVCLRAFDYNNQIPVSADHCSNTFTIAYPPPPSLNTPECESNIVRTDPQNILFNWQTPLGIPSIAQPMYRFTIVVLPDGIDAISALQNATDPVYSVETSNTSINYGISQPFLQSSRRYAWRVQVYDNNEQIEFQNDGYSEPCTFNYMEPGSSGNPFTLVFPLDGDTLPWVHMPIMHRFDPYSDDYVHYSHQFELRRNGTEVDTYDADNNWPNGPQQTQSTFLSGITQEQSQHLNLYKPLSGSPIPFNSGEAFDWEADIQLNRTPDVLITGSLSGSFVTGMGRPRPIAPMNGDSVQTDTEVTLRFATAAPPSRLVPPFALMQTSGANHVVNFFNSGIDERWLLEISRSTDFATVIASKSKRIGQGLAYNSGSCVEQCLLDSLYRDELFTYTPADTGVYYWRVRWMMDPTSESGPSYHDGPTWRFIVKDSLGGGDPEPPTPGVCVNTCEGPTIFPSERVPVTTAAVGTNVTIGMFTMNITEITWSGSLASGRGTIFVPFMRAPLKVVFNSVNINAANRIYQGVVRGEYDNSTIIPAGIAEGVSHLGAMSESEAQTLNTFVNSAGRLVSQFATDVPTGLPIGLDQTVDDQRVTIGIVGLKFTPETAQLNAMVTVDIPAAHGWLSLGATDVCFHPDGIGGDGRSMLYLPLDHEIPFSDSITLRFNRTEFNADYSAVLDSGTFVSWDCQGFRSLAIDGAILFGRDMLVEDMPDGTEGPHQIQAEFTAKVRRRSQWLTRIHFNHPFQVKGVPGWGFEVEEAWLDFADTENPIGFRFPTSYDFEPTLYNPTGADVPEEEAAAYWNGFYLKRQSIRLPPEFRTYSSPDNRLAFAVNDMLIDRSGLSASFRIENLFEVTDGNLNGWGFSMDTLMVDVVQNSFSQGGFVGEIMIPASDSALVYSSMIRQNLVSKNFRYELRVEPKDTINADLWAAKLALNPTSYIQATIDSAGVFARAELSGKMTIDATLDGVGRINFQLMDFQELGFQTRAPYIDCSDCMSMGFASPQKWLAGSPPSADGQTGESGNNGMSGFPVNIDDIGLTIREGAGGGMRAGVVFTLSLNLSGENNGFTAATTLAVMGRINVGGGTQQVWEFDGVDLDSIGVEGDVGVVRLEGGLRIYNGDMTYGNGFKGMIRATFKPMLSVQVIAQFGEKSGYRYWMVDAQAVFTPGITLMAGLDVFGFGGGAWYHMRRTSELPSAASLHDTSDAEDATEEAPPGLTLSGVTYVPDQSVGLGFRATVIFGSTGNGQAYNADVTFGAQISETGGLISMYLDGNGYFMCEVNDRSNPQIHARVYIEYNDVDKVFDGLFTVTVNVAGGLLKGVNPGNNAGSVHIHADPEEWYIHVGTPSSPVGLDVLGMFRMESYLMVGENLPPPPDPPANVMSIITPTTIVRHPGLDSADGFAFGSRVGFDTGRLGLPPFYARLNMGMGFDIALLNYGPDVFCEGAPPGSTIGIDGWYANGQMYAYIGMDIGIYVDLWFTSGEFSIIKANMAALLQAGLPNPSWVQGVCGGNYSILNGLVTGNCQFEFKIGQECRPAPESPLAGVEILEDLVPYNNERNVDCGTNPEASFNLEVEQQFDLIEITSDNTERIRRFRVVIDKFELRKGGVLVQTTRNVAPNKFKACLIPSAFLDPYTDYTVSIKLRGEEYNFSTSSWTQALKRDGTPISAEQTNTFTTGAYPDRIPESNVAYSYPFNTQRYFLQDECRSGMVQLKASMDPLFTTTPTSTTVRKFIVRFIPIDGGAEKNTTLTYSGYGVNFQIPDLQNNKVYACQIISKDSSIYSSSSMVAGAAAAAGLSATPLTGASVSSLSMVTVARISTLSESYSSLGSGALMRNNRIDGRSVRSNEKLLYVFFFKTSQFNTLAQKMQGHSPSTTSVQSLWGVDVLEPKYTGGEKFDLFDVHGFPYMIGTTTPTRTKSLVYFADARSDNWNTTYTKPVIYDLYTLFRNNGLTSLRLLRPVPDTIGIPPYYTVRFDADYAYTSPLAPNEFLPLSASASSVFSNLAISTIASSTITSSGIGGFGSFTALIAPPSTLHLNVNTSVRTYADYSRMVTIGNNVMGYFGHPQYSEFYTPTVRTKFLQFLGYGWRPMYRGTYEFNYMFRPPAYLCDTLDDFMSTPPRKSYTY
jgi:TANFOR domain-containing protein